MEGEAAGASGSQAHHAYFTRSKLKDQQWKAAGVLPFSFHDGACWVLLGGELVRTGPLGKYIQLTWRDFGGHREAIDEDSAATASRECSEETLGMLFGCTSADDAAVQLSNKALVGQLRSTRQSMCVVHPLRKGAYHMYVCCASFLDPLMFALASQQNAARTHPMPGSQEKILFAWVHIVDLLKTVAKARSSYTLHGHRTIVSRGPGLRPVPRKLLLHPCFACSLRIAMDAGLLTLVTTCRPPARIITIHTAENGAHDRMQVPGQGPAATGTAIAVGTQGAEVDEDMDMDAAALAVFVPEAEQDAGACVVAGPGMVAHQGQACCDPTAGLDLS